MSEWTIKEIGDKSTWEAFQLAQARPQFLQSWQAGELAKSMGEEIVRFGMYKNNELVSTLYASIVRAKRGSFLFVPYGPVQADLDDSMLKAWLAHCCEVARAKQLDFLRICPFLPDTKEYRELFSSAGFSDAPIHTLAEYLWMLDITPDEETLLKGMSKTTRNLVRRAQRDGVTVTQSTDAKDVEAFLSLHALTKVRHAFTPYPDKLFRNQVAAFAADNQTSVFCASHNGEVIASAIVMYYGGMASYHHGASKPSKIPAAYALQWEAIREGKKRGCHTYNFWGISDLSNAKHPFYGISLFKSRFGGYPYTLLKSQDYALTAKYTLTKTIEIIRRIRRGFGIKRHNY